MSFYSFIDYIHWLRIVNVQLWWLYVDQDWRNLKGCRNQSSGRLVELNESQLNVNPINFLMHLEGES